VLRVSSHRLEREQLVRAPLGRVFEFFSKAQNLEALTPPWLRFQVLTPEPLEMRVGTVIEYRLRLRGVPMRWVSVIDEWEPGRRFVDRQLCGPYRVWHHTHEFAPHPDGTLVCDRVRYAIPFGPLGALARRAFVRRDLGRVFDFRRQAVVRLLQTSPSPST
jgi:ligand-binding SRPBCC domain-containing protein